MPCWVTGDKLHLPRVIESKNTPADAQGLWSAFIVSTAEALTWQWKGKVVEYGWIMLNSIASRIYDRHQLSLSKDCEILHRWLLSEFAKSPSGCTGLKHAMPWTIWTISIHFLNCRYCRHIIDLQTSSFVGSLLGLVAGERQASAHFCALGFLTIGRVGWPQDHRTSDLSFVVVWSYDFV